MALDSVMIDIETLGTKVGSVIPSIGLVAFDSEKQYEDIEELRYNSLLINLDISTQLAEGKTVDASTLLWWLGQSEEARLKLIEGQKTDNLASCFAATMAMYAFMDIDYQYRIDSTPLAVLEVPAKEVKVYGNGSVFDIAHLNHMIKTGGIDTPWSYRNELCYRTLINSPLYSKDKIKAVKDSLKGKLVAHSPVDDAIYQVMILQNAKA